MYDTHLFYWKKIVNFYETIIRGNKITKLERRREKGSSPPTKITENRTGVRLVGGGKGVRIRKGEKEKRRGKRRRVRNQ